LVREVLYQEPNYPADAVKQANTPHDCSVKGRVIEIFQREGRPVVRVSVDAFYLDLPSDSLPDAHLKDSVIIRGNMTIEEVRNDYIEAVLHAKT